MMTIECPRINQQSAGSDNPSIANSSELRQKKTRNGKKKMLCQLGSSRKDGDTFCRHFVWKWKYEIFEQTSVQLNSEYFHTLSLCYFYLQICTLLCKLLGYSEIKDNDCGNNSFNLCSLVTQFLTFGKLNWFCDFITSIHFGNWGNGEKGGVGKLRGSLIQPTWKWRWICSFHFQHITQR